MKQSTVFFTIVARNYLAYAYVLGESVKRYHPDVNFVVFLMDDVNKEYVDDVSIRGFVYLSPEMIDFPNYKQFVFKYNITEASTGIKPFVIQYLLNKGSDKIIYLDPDILCFRRFSEVLNMLDQYSIILTPHSNSPISDDYFPDDYLFLSSGVYNLGFIAVSKGSTTEEFISWWSRRLRDKCLDATEMNLFVDQKWIDLVPAYFDKVLIFKSLAYNIAYWNLHERNIRNIDGTMYVFPTEEPVAFIHFSGMVVNDTGEISKYGPRSPFNTYRNRKRLSLDDRPDLVEPFKQYAHLVLTAGLEHYTAIPYAFNEYTNKDQISQVERSIYYNSPEWQNKDLDPFVAKPKSFWAACRNAGIRQAKGNVSRSSVEDVNQKYKIAFKAIQFMLRISVRILGPNAYASFAKYMRQQLLLTNHDFLLK